MPFLNVNPIIITNTNGKFSFFPQKPLNSLENALVHNLDDTMRWEVGTHEVNECSYYRVEAIVVEHRGEIQIIFWKSCQTESLLTPTLTSAL